MATNIPYGSQQAVVVQSAGLFAANMQRNTTLNRLTGKMPQQADAEGTIRKQSSKTMPIVRAVDLAKGAGDEITFVGEYSKMSFYSCELESYTRSGKTTTVK